MVLYHSIIPALALHGMPWLLKHHHHQHQLHHQENIVNW